MTLLPRICISIVSHGQAALVSQLLSDIAAFDLDGLVCEILITCNIPESPVFSCNSLPIKIISNAKPKGFAANHNAAFEQSKGDYFCVLNPDIRMPENPFKVLLDSIKTTRASMVAPTIVSPNLSREDSARYFPTLGNTLGRLFASNAAVYPVVSKTEPYEVDWVGGMFMLFDARSFRAVGGFDDKFYLYYEDADICTRLWQKNLPLWVVPKASIIHEAQRKSHRNLRYLIWHIKSMFRYFAKHWPNYPRR